MGNQYETLIPSKLKYTTLFSHRTNNSQLKSTIEFNLSIYNNLIDYLLVDIAYLFDNNWTEFKRLIGGIDRAYNDIG